MQIMIILSVAILKAIMFSSVMLSFMLSDVIPIVMLSVVMLDFMAPYLFSLLLSPNGDPRHKTLSTEQRR